MRGSNPRPPAIICVTALKGWRSTDWANRVLVIMGFEPMISDSKSEVLTATLYDPFGSVTFILQGVGFEPTHLTIAGLKSAALDHSANLASPFYFFDTPSFFICPFLFALFYLPFFILPFFPFRSIWLFVLSMKIIRRCCILHSIEWFYPLL